MARYLYSELSKAIDARKNCLASGNNEWFEKHTDLIEKLVSEHMPHGSGFDSGTKIDLDASHADKLVFTTSFHHMDEGGGYDGWTEHTVAVTPSLSSKFHLRISGRNRNDIKEMMYQEFDYCLSKDVTYSLFRDHYPELNVVHKWENEDGTPSQCYQAFYVGGKRFWNHYTEAYEYAGKLMENKFYQRA